MARLCAHFSRSNALLLRRSHLFPVGSQNVEQSLNITLIHKNKPELIA